MSRTTVLTLTATLAVLAGCASHPEPIIDERGVDMAKYQADLADCERYAEKISVTEGAARGAVVGAVVGAAAGSIGGDADRGAGYGGIYGGAKSGLGNNRQKHQVVRKCLAGRGYTVLN